MYLLINFFQLVHQVSHKKLGLHNSFEVPARFENLRETCRTSCGEDFMDPSQDTKIKTVWIKRTARVFTRVLSCMTFSNGWGMSLDMREFIFDVCVCLGACACVRVRVRVSVYVHAHGCVAYM